MPFNTGRIVQSQLAKPCVGTEELFDDCIKTSKISDTQITSQKIVNWSVGYLHLKHLQSSWAISVPGGTTASVTLTDFAFFPRQRTQSSQLHIWMYWPADYPVEQHLIFARNNSGSNLYWWGSYYYVTSSEQMVEVYRDISTNNIMGVYVTEKGNDNGVRYYNNNIEISVKREVYNYINTPNLFEDKICKLTASKIINNLLEKKAIDERD